MPQSASSSVYPPPHVAASQFTPFSELPAISARPSTDPVKSSLIASHWSSRFPSDERFQHAMEVLYPFYFRPFSLQVPDAKLSVRMAMALSWMDDPPKSFVVYTPAEAERMLGQRTHSLTALLRQRFPRHRISLKDMFGVSDDGIVTYGTALNDFRSQIAPLSGDIAWSIWQDRLQLVRVTCGEIMSPLSDRSSDDMSGELKRCCELVNRLGNVPIGLNAKRQLMFLCAPPRHS